MTLLDDLTATHWHVSQAAHAGVPPHRRLEIAAMTDPVSINAMIDRLETARNQARHFALDDEDKGSDFDRANKLRRAASNGSDYVVAGLATALDDLFHLAHEAQATIRALQREVARKDAEIAAERSRVVRDYKTGHRNVTRAGVNWQQEPTP